MSQYPPPPGPPTGPPPGPPYGPPWGSPYGGAPQQPGWDVMDAIRYGWRKFSENWAPFVLVGLLALGTSVALSVTGSLLAYGGPRPSVEPGASFGEFWAATFHPVETLFNLLGQVAALVFTAAAIRGAFDVAEGRRAELGAMFTRWSLLHVLVASLLTSLMVAVGLVACVLPGIVLLYFTWFTNYFVVGDRRDALGAIADSFRFAARHPGQLLLLALMSFLIVLAGICACGVGILVAMPVVTIAAVYTFRVLQGRPVAP